MPKRFQIDSTKVTKAFLVKFGSCFVLPNIPKEEIKTEKLIDEIRERLNQSPIFRKVEVLHLLPTKAYNTLAIERMTGPSSSVLEAVKFTPLVRCTLVLPIKNQEDSLEAIDLQGNEIVDTTTNFEILYDGSIYAIIREIDLKKRFHPGVYDIRDTFMETIQNEPFWKRKEIPPNPLRQDFIFVFLVEDQQTKELIGRTFKKRNIMYSLLSSPSSGDFTKIIGSSFQKGSFGMTAFYTTLSRRMSLDKLADDLTKVHHSIQSTIKKLSKLWYFNIYGHYKESKRLEKLVFQHYLLILNYTNELEGFKKEAMQIKDMIEDSMFRILEDEFLDELKPREVDIDTFSKCIEYAQEVAGKSYTTKITILSAVLGVIGAIMGTLILHYLGV